MGASEVTNAAEFQDAADSADSHVTGEAATVEPASRKLTRNDVAALMGVSPSTVVRRERAGVLRAEILDGVHVYDELEVRRTITTSRHRSAISTLGGASGDIAALVFTELDGGASEIDIVKRHALAPSVVRALAADYREFRQEVTIRADELASLRSELERLCARPAGQPRRLTCQACGRAHRVRACAACLASASARVERRTLGDTDEVRYVIDDDMGTSIVADWTSVGQEPSVNRGT